MDGTQADACDQRESFAGVVDEVAAANPAPAGQPVEWCQVIGAGEYADEAGVCWRIRGGELSWKRIERLARDPEVRVVHVYQNEIRDVPPEGRPGLLGMIRPYLVGTRRRAGDHTDFRAGEFKDDLRRSLLVVEESC